MTANDRFVQVMAHIDEERQELILTQTSTDESPETSISAKAIRHDFKTIRVSSIDT